MTVLTWCRLLKCLLLICIFVWGMGAQNALQAEISVDEAQQAMRRATDYFTTQVSTEGGYLWHYSRDLKYREGEGRARDTMVWVQPPGTPTVGAAYLEAYQKTGQAYLLKAARAAGEALIKGQLKSGGWNYYIDFKRRAQMQYRIDGGGPKVRNTTTFDDNTSQAALHFLILLDQELKFKDEAVHGAVMYALDAFLKAQYPNGGWPQRYDEFPDPQDYPVLKASYPESWSRTFPKKKYLNYYTFNDNTIEDLVNVMFLAHHVYQDDRYREAALKAGDFILLAQMPEPQPAWAQQYNQQMQPAWARKFEPPAVTGGESQGIIKTLMQIYIYTGDKKYLAPIPKALAYLKKSELPGGKLARFYELKTNRPLYFTKKYELTYKDNDLPTHYGFIIDSKVDSLESRYEKLLKASPEKLKSQQFPQRRLRLTPSLAARAQSVVNALNKDGAWLIQGDIRSADLDNVPIIDTRVFVRNLSTLAEFIAASQQD